MIKVEIKNKKKIKRLNSPTTPTLNDEINKNQSEKR
jgi:hypothetical protein